MQAGSARLGSAEVLFVRFACNLSKMIFDFYDRFCVATDMAQTVNVITSKRSFQTGAIIICAGSTALARISISAISKVVRFENGMCQEIAERVVFLMA